MGRRVPARRSVRPRHQAGLEHPLSPRTPIARGRFDHNSFTGRWEHFDEAGRYRDQEVGLPVDSASHVPAEDGSVLFEFASQEELMTKLAEEPELYQCFAGSYGNRLWGYLLGVRIIETLDDIRAGREADGDDGVPAYGVSTDPHPEVAGS